MTRVPIDPKVGPVVSAVTGNNADLIANVARLYLRKDDFVLDLTYGEGVFWKKVKPRYLTANDEKFTVDREKSRFNFDFRTIAAEAPAWRDLFNIVAFDPPYLTGGQHAQNHLSDRFGLGSVPSTTRSKHGSTATVMGLYEQGMENAKQLIIPGGTLWVKCQDGVDAGHLRFNHIDVMTIGETLGLDPIDLFVLVSSKHPRMRHKYQKTARRNNSFLWVFRKGKK